jgi:hypothetical protein
MRVSEAPRWISSSSRYPILYSNNMQHLPKSAAITDFVNAFTVFKFGNGLSFLMGNIQACFK